MVKIILASASPRRKELFNKLGLKFKAVAINYDEHIENSHNPKEAVKALSLLKARGASAKHKGIVIAADTIGVTETGEIIGKPEDKEDAARILRTLSGKAHRVITGYTVMDTVSGKTVTRSVETKVWFRELSEAEVAAYVKTGEPMGKAGAYAIQGKGALLVEKIEGDYYNVVGLPLADLAQTLKDFGIYALGVPDANAAADSPAR